MVISIDKQDVTKEIVEADLRADDKAQKGVVQSPKNKFATQEGQIVIDSVRLKAKYKLNGVVYTWNITKES